MSAGTGSEGAGSMEAAGGLAEAMAGIALWDRSGLAIAVRVRHAHIIYRILKIRLSCFINITATSRCIHDYDMRFGKKGSHFMNKM
jgi:hypothetical protein